MSMGREQSIADRLLSRAGAHALILPAYQPPAGYDLLQIQMEGPAETFGVALFNPGSRHVAYWAQVSILHPITLGGRAIAHLMSVRFRIQAHPSHPPRQASIDSSLALDHLLPRFDLLYSRDALGWHSFLVKLSAAASRGQSIYRLADKHLSLLDSDDVVEQNEDFTALVHGDPQGLCCVTSAAHLDGEEARLDLRLVREIEATWSC